MNNEFHQLQKYQKINEYQFINSMFFGAKKKETTKVDDTSSKDLELVTKMNQEFAKTLDLKETLNNSLELIIKRINAQAANIFLIDEKNLKSKNNLAIGISIINAKTIFIRVNISFQCQI